MVHFIERYRNLGSAAMLLGEQTILFIFVDDDGADPWTPHLRTPVEEKIARSLRWLESKSQERGIGLRLQHVCIPTGKTACRTATRVLPHVRAVALLSRGN
jgi:hypothetical protein